MALEKQIKTGCILISSSIYLISMFKTGTLAAIVEQTGGE